jgi:hypothetical protein
MNLSLTSARCTSVGCFLRGNTLFKKILLRSVASTAAIGSALAVSLVATPAVVTTAPEVRNVACEVKYPGSVSTTTQLSLGRYVGAYGVANFATARVSRDEANAKTPVGRVRFRLINPDGTLRRAWKVQLRNGEATVGLPRRLGAQNTYTVRANYIPPDCSIFQRSASAPAYYTVNKAGTRTVVRAPDRTHGQNGRVNVRLRTASPFTPQGKVRIVVKRGDRVVARQVRKLNDGKVSANFRKFAVGKFNVRAVYLGAKNFKRGAGNTGFRITR